MIIIYKEFQTQELVREKIHGFIIVYTSIIIILYSWSNKIFVYC